MFGKGDEPSQLSILLIEDDIFQQRLIARRLQQESFIVVAVSNATEAIKEIQNKKFAVAIVDLGLPDSKGLELVRQLHKASRETSVIIYSADSSFESAKESLNLGVLGYVGKSEDLRVLIERIHFAATKYLNDVLTRAEGEIRFHLRVLDIVEDGVIATNLNYELIYWNRFAIDLLGNPPQIAYGKSGLDLLCVRRTCKAVVDNLKQVKKGIGIGGQIRLRRWQAKSESPLSTPSRVAVRYRASPILDKSKNVIGYVFSFSDITLERRNQAELEVFATQQATLAKIGSIAISAKNVDEFLSEIAPCIQHAMRVDLCTFEGNGTNAENHPRNDRVIFSHVQNGSYQYRFDIKRNNWPHPIDSMVLNSNKDRIFNQAEQMFLQSISELISNTIERFYAASRWKSLFENSLNAVLLLDDKGEIVDANQATAQLLGYQRHDLPKMLFSSILPINETSVFKKLWENFRKQKTMSGALQLRTISGEYRDTKYVAVANVVQGLHMFDLRDVTEERQLEQKVHQDREMLAHFQRNAAIGQMAAVLAHEINQPLGAISNFVGGLLFDVSTFEKLSNGPKKMEIENDRVELSPAGDHQLVPQIGNNELKVNEFGRFAELGGTLKEVQRQALRAGEIVRRLRRYVSRRPSDTKAFDINELILDTLQLLHNDFRLRQIEEITCLNKDIPLMNGDAIQIQQVVVNLLRNALDALSDTPTKKGMIKIVTESEDNHIVLKVTDNGQGTSESEIPKLFEPYYTSRPNGLGLGLSISKTIVERHQGTIAVAHAQEGGLEFTVRFPCLPSNLDSELLVLQK